MNLDIALLQNTLCQLLCAEVKIHRRSEKLLFVETPFTFSDGDPYQIYIKELPGGNLRLSDMGHTLLHLSYENDTGKFREGTRGKIFDQIKSELSIDEENGEFYIDTQLSNLGSGIFQLGQALIKISDLTFLNRARAESTFYEDLRERLFKVVEPENVLVDYYYEQLENARDYPIDYRIEGIRSPLFLFGVPNKDKARLTTIVLERLVRGNADFESLIVFLDQGSIPKPDLARLSNIGGEMIASLDAEDDFKRKILRKVV